MQIRFYFILYVFYLPTTPTLNPDSISNRRFFSVGGPCGSYRNDILCILILPVLGQSGGGFSSTLFSCTKTKEINPILRISR